MRTTWILIPPFPGSNPGTPAKSESAKATGFRSCRRCNPDGPSEAENAALVAKACRIIEESEEEPSLEELADAIGRSPSYFHRLFNATTGLTPKDYAAAHRAKKVRQGLASGNTVTEAIYDAGFSSSGRFYEKSTGMLGMTPSQYRAGGANEEIRFAVGQTSLGAILVARRARRLRKDNCDQYCTDSFSACAVKLFLPGAQFPPNPQRSAGVSTPVIRRYRCLCFG
jgi:methylphosphotriester-DNA--protein-cysteine methyltransferase